jgi:hypothetical protein
MACRLVRLMRAREPLELIRPDDVVAHRASLVSVACVRVLTDAEGSVRTYLLRMQTDDQLGKSTRRFNR